MVGGGDSELQRDMCTVELIGKYGKELSEEPRWIIFKLGQRGIISVRAIQKYRPRECRGNYSSNPSPQLSHARD